MITNVVVLYSFCSCGMVRFYIPSVAVVWGTSTSLQDVGNDLGFQVMCQNSMLALRGDSYGPMFALICL